MWKIIQQLLPFLLIVLFITQYVLPIILDKPTWWLFKSKSKVKSEPKETIVQSTLSDELKVTKTYVEDVKSKVEIVREKVDGNLKTAEDLKKEANKLI